MKYSEAEYSGYLLRGKLKDAIAYLEQFPEKSDKIEKFRQVFQMRILPRPSDNPIVNDILYPFYMYYHDVFFDEIGEEASRVLLTERLAELFKLDCPRMWTSIDRETFFCNEIEPRIEELVVSQGFHYMGGETQGHKGPYIWKETENKTFDVQLPNQKTQYTVNLLSGFISRSWLAYISLNEIGTGGWAGRDGIINCVIEAYSDGVESEDFQVSLLKHEAQHIIDYDMYPKISSIELEYRAKLVELIYAANNTFPHFLQSASKEDSTNSHAYSSYKIVRDLSMKIWGVEYETDLGRWKNVEHQIKDYALELYEEFKI